MIRLGQILLKLWNNLTHVSYVRKTEEQFALDTTRYLQRVGQNRQPLPARGVVRY